MPTSLFTGAAQAVSTTSNSSTPPPTPPSSRRPTKRFTRTARSTPGADPQRAGCRASRARLLVAIQRLTELAIALATEHRSASACAGHSFATCTGASARPPRRRLPPPAACQTGRVAGGQKSDTPARHPIQACRRALRSSRVTGRLTIPVCKPQPKLRARAPGGDSPARATAAFGPRVVATRCGCQTDL
jgi:hypothetical protein